MRMWSEEFRKRLADGKYTGWAKDLDEERARGLLWLLGEYGARGRAVAADAGSVEVSTGGNDASRVAAALQGLLEIVAGAPLTGEEAIRRIAEGRDRFRTPSGPDGMIVRLREADAPESCPSWTGNDARGELRESVPLDADPLCVRLSWRGDWGENATPVGCFRLRAELLCEAGLARRRDDGTAALTFARGRNGMVFLRDRMRAPIGFPEAASVESGAP